ncbi:MAG: hypothetical protein QOE69_314 [Thermoleophilaceae bacterium]|jgi:hypothetical protein|nr:hypothetical protein [Thermoleophilaceae bacterium]
MADEQPTTEFDAQSDAPPPGAGQSPLSVGTDEDVFAERPEAFVGAAFAGGLALAMILRRFAR